MKNKFSNKIAVKLTFYFAAVLLTFSLIMGALFYQFFKQHNIDLTKKEMNLRAVKIAEVISADLDWLQGRYGEKSPPAAFRICAGRAVHLQSQRKQRGGTPEILERGKFRCRLHRYSGA